MNDVVIIGLGPAGLTASIYASCYHLSHVVIGDAFGGQMALSPDILNYPGFNEISGKELTNRMVVQAKGLGAVLVEALVVAITKIEGGFHVKTEKGEAYDARVVILATGTERRKLNVLGERQYLNKGVYYWSTSEQQNHQEKTVAVVGGGNAAAQSAVQLANTAAKVYLLCRGTELRCDAIWSEQIATHKNIEILYGTQVAEIIGDGQKVTGLKIMSKNQKKQLSVEKVFIEIGGVPGTSLVTPLGVDTDIGGFIKVDDKLATNVPGIFAAGDLVSYGLSIEQISTAVGLGARAAASAFSYIKQQKAPTSWGQALIKR